MDCRDKTRVRDRSGRAIHGFRLRADKNIHRFCRAVATNAGSNAFPRFPHFSQYSNKNSVSRRDYSHFKTHLARSSAASRRRANAPMECRGEISIAVVTNALSPLTSRDVLFLSLLFLYGIVGETVSARAIVSAKMRYRSGYRTIGLVALGSGISVESRSCIIVLPIDLSLFNFYTSATLTHVTELRDSKSIFASI